MYAELLKDCSVGGCLFNFDLLPVESQMSRHRSHYYTPWQQIILWLNNGTTAIMLAVHLLCHMQKKGECGNQKELPSFSPCYWPCSTQGFDSKRDPSDVHTDTYIWIVYDPCFGVNVRGCNHDGNTILLDVCRGLCSENVDSPSLLKLKKKQNPKTPLKVWAGWQTIIKWSSKIVHTTGCWKAIRWLFSRIFHYAFMKLHSKTDTLKQHE